MVPFKWVSLRVVVMGFTVWTSAHIAWAQQAIVLPEVVVTATRLRDVEEKVARVPARVTIVTAEEIEKSGARTVQEVLQHQPGVVLYDSIGNAFQSTVDLRGFNAQPVTTTNVFVDGVRVNEPDFNRVNFDLIPIEDIERIEILPGTSAIFGKNALAGVVNIITKRGGAKHQVVGEAGFGSYNRMKLTVGANGPLKAFDYYVSATRELEDGFRDESDGRITRLLAKVGYKLGTTTDMTLSYTHVNDRLKQAGSLPLSELLVNRRGNFSPGDFSDALLNMGTLNVRQKLPLGFSLAMNGFFRSNKSELFTVGRTSEAQKLTDTASGGWTIQMTQEASPFGRRNALTAGIEYTHNDFDDRSSSRFFGFPLFLGRGSTNEELVGLYVQDSFDLLRPLTLIAGFRYDRNRLDFTDELQPANSGQRSFERVSPRAGFTLNPTEWLGFYFNYSVGFRSPTGLELFALGPFGSNPDLRPVRSRNYEAGVKGRLGRWLEGSVALFHTDVKDEIFFVITDPINLFGRNENISETRRRGLELSLKARYRDLVDGFLSYTLTETTFQTGLTLPAVTTPSFFQEVQKGDEFPLVPRHRLSAGLNIHPLKAWTLSLNALYVSSQFLLGDEANVERKLDPYFVLDARIAFQKGGFTAFVAAQNVLDAEYETFGILAINPSTFTPEPFLVPAPEFNIFGGVSYRFDL